MPIQQEWMCYFQNDVWGTVISCPLLPLAQVFSTNSLVATYHTCLADVSLPGISSGNYPRHQAAGSQSVSMLCCSWEAFNCLVCRYILIPQEDTVYPRSSSSALIAERVSLFPVHRTFAVCLLSRDRDQAQHFHFIIEKLSPTPPPASPSWEPGWVTGEAADPSKMSVLSLNSPHYQWI